MDVKYGEGLTYYILYNILLLHAFGGEIKCLTKIICLFITELQHYIVMHAYAHKN